MTQSCFRRDDITDALFQSLGLGEATVSKTVPHEDPIRVWGLLHKDLEGAWDKRRSENN